MSHDRSFCLCLTLLLAALITSGCTDDSTNALDCRNITQTCARGFTCAEGPLDEWSCVPRGDNPGVTDTSGRPDTTDTTNGPDFGDIDGPFADYFFVRIVPGAGTPASEAELEDPGADIDVVMLIKDDGRFIAPALVELLSDMTQYRNYKPRSVDSAGQRLDAFNESDPLTVTSSSTCSVSSDNFVSIGLPGDEGGVWTFSQAIRERDTIAVVEVGGCVREVGGATPMSEPYSIEVSVSTEAGANWVNIGQRIGDAPLTTISVPRLPLVPLRD